MTEKEKIIRDCSLYISSSYPISHILKGNYEELSSYISKYLTLYPLPKGYDKKELVKSIYNELAGFSIISEYLKDERVEEININSHNEIYILYSSGEKVKINEAFSSPEHSLNIIRRLLYENGGTLDYSNPISSSYYENNGTNIRVTSILPPLVSKEKGACASIRILHPGKIDLLNLVENDFASKEELDLLHSFLKYNVSICISGKTGSGKTTLLSSLLKEQAKDKRIFTIEQGAREIFNIKERNYDLVSTLTKKGKNGDEISQEDLLFTSLRFSPDIIALGEMRNNEAHACVEASLTGHTVISTVHSGPGSEAHTRIALLTQRKFPISFDYSVKLSRLAFPIIVFVNKCNDGIRRIIEISEYDSENEKYNILYKYSFASKKHEKINECSLFLQSKMENYGKERK